MKYARFLGINGDPVYINPAHVLSFERTTPNGFIYIAQPEGYVKVKGDLDHVATTLENALDGGPEVE